MNYRNPKISQKHLVLLELRCNWVAYDTNIVVGANGRSPRRQGFWSLINSTYYPKSNRPKHLEKYSSYPSFVIFRVKIPIAVV